MIVLFYTTSVLRRIGYFTLSRYMLMLVISTLNLFCRVMLVYEHVYLPNKAVK